MSAFEDQLARVQSDAGFIAALDQSGGSTPKALRAYGVGEDAYSGDDEMFAQVHAMRTRIITSPAFTRDRVLGAILFENTIDRDIQGIPTAQYLWEQRGIVPFLKVDKGLEDERDGVRRMKPIPGLDDTLAKARRLGIFGTKMRSVILQADTAGIDDIVAQQFEVGRQIAAAGLVPIIEPEVDIHAPDKAEAEAHLVTRLLEHLDLLGEPTVLLKLTLPEVDDLYRPCIAHPRVARVVALSGGYPRTEANARLTRQRGMIASFSRALAEGLSFQQSDAAFDQTLDASIRSIFEASLT